MLGWGFSLIVFALELQAVGSSGTCGLELTVGWGLKLKGEQHLCSLFLSHKGLWSLYCFPSGVSHPLTGYPATSVPAPQGCSQLRTLPRPRPPGPLCSVGLHYCARVPVTVTGPTPPDGAQVARVGGQAAHGDTCRPTLPPVKPHCSLCVMGRSPGLAWTWRWGFCFPPLSPSRHPLHTHRLAYPLLPPCGFLPPEGLVIRGVWGQGPAWCLWSLLIP